MAILVYSENLDTTLELVNLASSKLEDSVSIALLGSRESVPKLSVEGVSSIFVASSPLFSNRLPEVIVDALEAICKEVKPNAVLIGASKSGKEVAPRLATRLGMGCISDAMHLSKGLSAERLVWGGNAIATVSSPGGAVVTIPQRANEKARGSSSPEIKEVQFSPHTRTSSVVGMKEKPKGQVSIKEAEAIVSAGRGFKKKEDLQILDGLAKELDAVIGASRPLTSDLGWMPEDRQVGLSGVSVKPKLYVAIGISGQIQHLTGMRDSKLVVAINNDKNAPIFQECDYGVVGDLYAIIPELTKAIAKVKGQ